jgi:DNA-binding LacI/PurR family transcriptional regulator
MIFHQEKNKIEYVASRLRERIQAGVIPAGARLSASARVAEQFAVSPMTADRAIRMLVKEGLLRRQRGVGTFVLAKKERLRIGIMGMERRRFLYERDYVFTVNTFPIIKNELSKLNAALVEISENDQIEKLKLDGLLLGSSPPKEKRLQIPIANYRNYQLLNRPMIQCVPDLENVFNQLFDYFCRREIRNYYIFSATWPNIKYFADFFCDKALEFGIKESDLKVSIADFEKDENVYHFSYRYGKALEDIEHSVVFSTSDFRSVGILQALDERGYKPGDYELVSCNNWEAYGYKPFTDPRLTSIDFRREECLRKCVEMLCQRAEGKFGDSIPLLKVPAFIKIRESAMQHK